MPEISDQQIELVDLAVVAYRDDDQWWVQDLRPEVLGDVESIAGELRRYPGESGALALIAVDEDFALLVRVQGPQVRVLLSDATAATDWTLARSAVDELGVSVDDEDPEVPAGDLGIVADLGLPVAELGALLDDVDLYPDEVLAEIARRLGFGDEFDELAPAED